MEEKLSDRICKEAFNEFYINKNYNKSLSLSKKVYRLLMRNNIKETKDRYYIWMILIVIIRSYNNLNQIEKSLTWILLALRESNLEYKKIECYCYLIQYYTNKHNTNKINHYIKKCVESCVKIGEYRHLLEITNKKV